MTNTNAISIKAWTAATFTGWIIGFIAVMNLSGFLEFIGIHKLQFYLGFGMALGVGLTQYFLLRRRRQMGLSWLWASLAGLGLPMLILDLLRLYGELPLHILTFILTGSVAGGLFVGWLQHRLLRKAGFRQTLLWIPANVVSWVLVALSIVAIDYTKLITSNNLALFFMNLSLILSGGIILGFITGYGFSVMQKPTT